MRVSCPLEIDFKKQLDLIDPFFLLPRAKKDTLTEAYNDTCIRDSYCESIKLVSLYRIEVL